MTERRILKTAAIVSVSGAIVIVLLDTITRRIGIATFDSVFWLTCGAFNVWFCLRSR